MDKKRDCHDENIRSADFFPGTAQLNKKAAEDAFDLFKDAWFAGEYMDAEIFCKKYAECGPALRRKIEDFTFVAEGLTYPPEIKIDASNDAISPNVTSHEIPTLSLSFGHDNGQALPGKWLWKQIKKHPVIVTALCVAACALVVGLLVLS